MHLTGQLTDLLTPPSAIISRTIGRLDKHTVKWFRVER
jgi:hypothetical protein